MKKEKPTYEELAKKVLELEKVIETKKVTHEVETSIENTESIKIENQLRFDNEILQNITEGVYLVRVSDGIIVYANLRFNKMFGYDSGELNGKFVSIVNAPDDKNPEEVASEIMNQLSKTGFWKGEVKNIRKDGTTFWSYATVSAFNHSQYGEVWICVHQDITDIKYAKIAEQDNEQRFRSIFENTGAGYFFIDNEYIIQDVNEAWIKLYKYGSRDEIVGQHFSIVQKLDDKTLAKEFIDGIRRSDKRYMEGVFSRKCKDNSIGYHNFSAWPVIKHGEVIGIEGFILDVTENIITEENLKISEVKFRNLVETTNDIIWETNLEDLYTYINPRVEKILGYKPEEMISHSPFEFMSRDEAEKIKKRSCEIIASKKSFEDLVNINLHKDGHQVILETSGVPVFDDNNKLIGYRGIDRDITERKISEKKLKESEDKFRYVFDYSNVGKSITLVSGEINVNQALCDLLGYSKEELQNKKWQDITHPDDIELTCQEINKIILGENEETRFNKRFLHKSGSVVWADCYSAARRNKEGELLYLMTTIIDITDRKLAEQKLIESKEKLHSVYESIPVPTYTWEKVGDDFILTNFNKAASKISKEQIANLVGIKASKMYSENPEIIESFFKCFDDRSTIEQEMNYTLHTTGETKYLNVKYAFVSPNQILVHTEDITERKLIEEQIKVLAKIPEENVNPVLRISKNCILLYSNPACKKLLSGCFPETGYKISEPWIKKINESIYSGQKHREEIEINGKVYSFEFAPIDGEYVNLYGRDISVRKNAENELRKSEEKFRNIFEDNSSAIAIIEADTTISMVNDAYCEMGGYTREEVIGMSWTKQIPPEGLGRLKEYNQRRLINPKDAPDKYEFTFYHKSGELKHGLMSVSVLQGEKKMIVSFTDITERILLEEKLKESIDLLRIAGKTAKLGGWNVILKENRSYWSDEVAAIHEMPAGYSPLVEDGINFYAPEWRERITKVFTDCALKGINYDEEMEIITANGKRVWVQTIGEAVKDDNGKIYKVQGSFQDITERIRAEEKFSSISKLQEAILASVPEIIMEVDNNKTYVWANNVGKEFFGNDVVGKDAAYFFEGEQDVYDKVNLLFNGDESIIYIESWQRRKDGEKRLLAWWCKVLKDENGNVTGALSTARDITEQKLVEEALIKSEARYRLLVESTDLGFVVIDEQGIVVTANEPYNLLAGMKDNESCIGHSVIEWTAPDEKENNAIAIFQCVQKGFIKDFETIYQHSNGKREYVLINANMQKSADGKNHIVSFCRNITERKLVESDLEMLNSINSGLNKGMNLDDMLSKSKQAIKKTFPVNHVDIYLTSNDGKFLLYQKENIKKEFITAFEKILPFKIPQTIKLSLHKDNWYSHVMLGKEMKITETSSDIESMIMAFVESNYEKVPFKKHLSKIITFFKENNIISSIPLVLNQKNIALLDVNFKSRPTENDLKRIKSFSEQLVVIIDRKRTEEALQKSEEKFHALYDNMIEGAALHELTYNDQGMPEDYIIIEVNPAFEKQLCVFRKSILGKTSRSAYGVTEPPYFEKYVRVVETGEPEVFESYFPPMEKYFSISAYCPYKGCFATIFEDITDRKKAEEKVKQHNELLLKLNLFSVELSMLPLENDLEAFIVKQLKEITGAEVALFNEYDYDKKAVIVKHIDMNPGLLEKAIGLLGRQVKKIQSPVSEAMYQEMTTEVIGRRTTLHDASFGAISRPVSSAIQALLKVDRFIGMAYQIDEKLYGTSLIALKKGQPDIQDEILETFVYLATMAMIRKKTELALCESEKKYRVITEKITDVIWLMNLEGKSTFVSSSIEKFTGYTVEEYLKQTIEERFTSESAKYGLGIFARELQFYKSDVEHLTNYSCTLELEYKCKDKSTKWGELLITPFYDEQKKLIGIHGVTRDITERKQLNKILINNNSRLELAMQTAKMAWWEMDILTGNVIFNNRKAEMLGYPIEKFNHYKDFMALVHPDDYEKAMNAMHKHFEGLVDKYEIEYRILTKSGDYKWFYDIGSIGKKDSNGKPLNVTGLVIDISERKKAEAELQFRNILLSTQQEVSFDGILIVDENANILSYNKRFVEMWGVPEELVKNKVDEPVLQYVTNQIKEPAEFLKRVNYLYENKHEISWDELVLADGRIFNRYTAPMFGSEKQYYGRVWYFSDITQRKQAETQLKISAEKWQTTFNSITDIISVISKNHEFLEINQAGCDSMGMERKDIIGKKCYELVHNLHNPVNGCPCSFALKTKKEETREIFENGRHLQLSAWPIFDENNEVIAFSHSVRDITENKKAEEALRDSEEKFSKAFMTSPYAISITNPKDGNFIEVNDAFTLISGYTREEVLINSSIGLEIWVKENDRKRVISDLLKGIEVAGKELKFKKKNGEILIGLFSAQIIQLNNKSYIISSINDITDSVKAKEALYESEKKYRLLADNSADVIFIFDMNFNYTYISPSVKRLRGYEPEELMGQSISNSLKPEGIAYAQKVIKEEMELERKGIADLNRSRALELEMFCKDGSIIWTEAKASVLRDDKNNPIGIIGVTRDITERKKAENDLKIAKEKAEESDRLKSAFLANMSHEIRTPMNGILGFSELLTEPGLSGEKQKEYIHIIENSGKRMLNIINDIVDISKIESGQVNLTISEVNINEQIEYIHTFFKPEVEQNGIQLFFKNSLSNNEAILKTDKVKAVAILTNLVKNAIKFTQQGSIEFGYVKKGEFLEFYVKDTGSGIRQGKIDVIFERFRQGSESLTRNYEGAGLGLSISKAYVEMLGGKMWVESEFGKGSIFYFTHPYTANKENKVEKKMVVNSGEDINIIKLKILIAEDDETSEKLISIAVRNIVKEVIVARTGIEAVKLCRNNPDIDLILMDIQMPEMNGYKATKEIRQFNKEVIIIAQTAYALAGENEKAIEAGCNDYISKPINKVKLTELIQKHFKK